MNFKGAFKTVLFALVSVCCGLLYGQRLDTLYYEKGLSIRALHLEGTTLYYGGSKGRVGTLDLGRSKAHRQVLVDSTGAELRSIAARGGVLYTASIGSPARLFRVEKSSLKAHKVFEDTLKSAFYDALHFTRQGVGIALSDPQGELPSLLTLDGGTETWKRIDPKSLPPYRTGEAAFAASNSNISSYGDTIWFATGGSSARVFRKKKDSPWEVFPTPIVQGSPSQGIYSIAFFDSERGIIAGGNYLKPEENEKNIAVTQDAGETWQIVASGSNAGYTTFVSYRPQSKGNDVLAVGDYHISLSRDGGTTWKVLLKSKGYYVGVWESPTSLIVAGNGLISRLDLNPFLQSK